MNKATPPPLLLGATLLFWGWQTGFPLPGALMAVIVEGARVSNFHWDLADEEFNRAWNFCAVLFIGAAVAAFTLNEGPAAVSRMADEPGFAAQRIVGETSQKTAAALFQWLPMVFCPFVVAHILSRRGPLRLATFSLILRHRKREADPASLAELKVPAGWVYFAICLISASIQTNSGEAFFAGLSALLAWALWVPRSRRFALPVWLGVVLAACALGFALERGLGELRRWVEGYTPQWAWHSSGHRTNPNEDNTAIGQIGRIKLSGNIVIRLEPREDSPPPDLLRTASYRNYRSTTWSAGRPQDESGPREEFGAVYAEPKSATWILRESAAPAAASIACYLEGEYDLLPLPHGIVRLDNLAAFNLKTNTLGTVIAEGPGVVVFDAHYSLSGSIDSAPTETDLKVPEAELQAVRQVIAEMDLAGKSTNQMLRAVAAFFQDHFTYSTWQRTRLGRAENRSALSAFLTGTNRSGHCEYFATATVLILRELGIPARYAVGWAVEEKSGAGYVIRERDAHAWCLAYHNGQWRDFDTTPPSWVAEEKKRASRLQWLSDAWARAKFEFLKWRWGQSNFRQYVWWIVGPMLLFLLYRLFRRKPGSRPRYKEAGAAATQVRPGLDSEFYLIEKKLAALGFTRLPGETLGLLLERALRDARVVPLKELLPALLRLHYQLRFDPLGLAQPEREHLQHAVREVLDQLGAKPGTEVARASRP